MKTEVLEIVDIGRGPQLSTSRVTVLDLVPYFQKNTAYDEIIRWIPSLTQEAISLVEKSTIWITRESSTKRIVERESIAKSKFGCNACSFLS